MELINLIKEVRSRMLEDKAKEMYLNGYSTCEIAKKLHISSRQALGYVLDVVRVG